MAVRERDEAWERLYQSLKWQIARRDADYLSLHHEFMAEQQAHKETKALLLKTLCRYLVAGVRDNRQDKEAGDG